MSNKIVLRIKLSERVAFFLKITLYIFWVYYTCFIKTIQRMSYNRIMAYKVEYNGLKFLNSPYNIKEWGWLVLKEFSFFEVATQSSTEKYAIRHWEYVSPTMMKNRRIRILFDIIASSEAERWQLLKGVQKAFSPAINPSPFNDKLWHELTFLDVDCKEWRCNCQVLQWIQLSDFANEKRVWISVELITDSPYFYSNQEYSITTDNTQMWIQLPVKNPFKRRYYKGVVNYQWTIEGPMVIEMDILNNDSAMFPYDKIKILHQMWEEIEVFYIEEINDLWLNVGDKIIVDTEKRRCYHENDTWTHDITWLVSVWSIRPNLERWLNIVAIDTGLWDKTIEATIKRKDLF